MNNSSWYTEGSSRPQESRSPNETTGMRYKNANLMSQTQKTDGTSLCIAQTVNVKRQSLIMEKKVYYGEYTLLHWIELILKHNIVLPDYQRGFVWPKENLASIVESFKIGSFVPPITIGVYTEGGVTNNIILDGQQRLTCLLLSYLKLYPKFESFKQPIENVYQDGEETSMDDTPLPEEQIVWKFDQLLDNNNPPKLLLTREQIREANQDKLDKYENLPATSCLSDEDLEKYYLGFSYIVPVDASDEDQQTFYSRLFRDINILGVSLENPESRKALYYLKPQLKDFFEPPFVHIHVSQNSKKTMFDFVRTLAFCGQYKHDGNSNSIAKGCRKQTNLEKYYADFIDAVISGRQSTTFCDFKTVIGTSNLQPRLTVLSNCINELHLNKIYDSIIDADLSLFGLIYYTLFEGKQFDTTDNAALTTSLSSTISQYRTEDIYAAHRRAPNALGNLRTRLQKSKDIFSPYAK